jgi:hypothetical protein
MKYERGVVCPSQRHTDNPIYHKTPVYLMQYRRNYRRDYAPWRISCMDAIISLIDLTTNTVPSASTVAIIYYVEL